MADRVFGGGLGGGVEALNCCACPEGKPSPFHWKMWEERDGG